MKNLFKNTNGQSLVEFALVLPLLIILILGIMEMGRVVEGYLELQNAARDGARYASVKSADIKDDTSRDTFLNSSLKPKVNGDLVMLDSSKVVVNLSKSPYTGENVDKWVTVNLTYDLKLMTPLIGDLIATDKTNQTIKLTAKMSMRGE